MEEIDSSLTIIHYGTKLHQIDVLFNLDYLFGRETWKDSKMPDLLKKKSKKYNLIFWISRKKVLVNETINRKIKMLSHTLDYYKIYFSTHLYAPPNNRITKYLSEKFIIAGALIGKYDIYINGKYEIIDNSPADYMLHLNCQNSQFIYIDNFLYKFDLAVYPEIAFNPRQYFEKQKLMYYKYHYDLEFLRTNKPETLFITGPPCVGKTPLAVNLARIWKYEYINKNIKLDINKSYIVDVNPISPGEYFGHNIRVFELSDLNLCDEYKKLVSTHLMLMHKTFNNDDDYHVKIVDNYFHADIRYPEDIKIEYIQVLYYQLFKEKYNNLIYKYYTCK